MEVWKPIQDFEHGYLISSRGQVKSVDRIQTSTQGSFLRKGRILKLANTRGYLHARLYKDGKVYDRYVHRLVAQAFIDNYDDLTEINHKDGDKQNNSVDNLEWVTREDNIQHARRSGLFVPDRTKLTAEKAKDIIRMRNQGATRAEVADKHGISENHVWSVTSGESWGWATEAIRSDSSH